MNDTTLSESPGSAEIIFNGEYIHFSSIIDKKHSIFSIPNEKFIDITNIINNNSYNYLRSDTVLSTNHNSRWFRVIPDHVLCTVHFYFNDGVSNIDVVHYDLKNDNKEINRMNISLMHCIVGCTCHINNNCFRNKKQETPSVSIRRLGLYEYMVSLPYNGNFKQKSACIFNVKTLEKKILDDCLLYPTPLDNLFFKKSNNYYLIYNFQTKKELLFSCDQIDNIFKMDAGKIILWYKSDGSYKFMVITNDLNIENPIKFCATLVDGIIKVVANDRFYEYECVIDSVEPYKFITSFEMMYEIIKDAIEKNNRDVVMTYTKKNDQLNVEIAINVKYITDKIHFVLTQKLYRKPSDNLEKF